MCLSAEIVIRMPDYFKCLQHNSSKLLNKTLYTTIRLDNKYFDFCGEMCKEQMSRQSNNQLQSSE